MTVDELIAAASAAPVKLTIHELLAVWGIRARTFENVDRVMRDLSAAGLSCQPDLEGGSLDTQVTVGLNTPVLEDDHEDNEDEPLQLPPLAPRIGDIPSASAGVMSVRPDQSLSYARALMIEHDYSQLPVMASERDLRGYVSWWSIAQAQLAQREIMLVDATRSHPFVVSIDANLLDQVPDIYKTNFVFVRSDDDRICGIVTSSDLSIQFRDLTTPFFQVGEIESRMRVCIDRSFTAEELQAAIGRAHLRSAADMMFGQYVQLLRDDTRWRQLGWGGIDHARFIQCLEDTRQIRNKIMHFGEELTVVQRQRLGQCLNYMRAMLPSN